MEQGEFCKGRAMMLAGPIAPYGTVGMGNVTGVAEGAWRSCSRLGVP